MGWRVAGMGLVVVAAVTGTGCAAPSTRAAPARTLRATTTTPPIAPLTHCPCPWGCLPGDTSSRLVPQVLPTLSTPPVNVTAAELEPLLLTDADVPAPYTGASDTFTEPGPNSLGLVQVPLPMAAVGLAVPNTTAPEGQELEESVGENLIEFASPQAAAAAYAVVVQGNRCLAGNMPPTNLATSGPVLAAWPDDYNTETLAGPSEVIFGSTGRFIVEVQFINTVAVTSYAIPPYVTAPPLPSAAVMAEVTDAALARLGS